MSMMKIAKNPITDCTEGIEQERNQRNNEQVNFAATKKQPSNDTDSMINKRTDLNITFQKSLILSQENSSNSPLPTATLLLDTTALCNVYSPLESSLLSSPMSPPLSASGRNRVMNNPYGLIRTTSPVLGHVQSPVEQEGHNFFSVENIEKQVTSQPNTFMPFTSFHNPPPLPPKDGYYQSKAGSEAPYRVHSPHSFYGSQEPLSPNSSTFSGHDQLMEIVNSYVPDTAGPFIPFAAHPEKHCVEIEQQERCTPIRNGRSDTNTSTGSNTNQQSLTKVYQNGRPIPAVRSHPPSHDTSVISRHSCHDAPEEAIINPTYGPGDTDNTLVPDFVVVMIQFRRCTELYTIRFAGKYLSIPLQGMLVNAHVITEGDRGFDLGRIIAVDEAATELMMEYRSKCTDEDLDLLMTFETAHSLKQACGIVPRKDNINNSNNNNGNGNIHINSADHHSMLSPTSIIARCAKFPFVIRNASQQEVDDFHYTQVTEESRALAYSQEQCARCLPLDISIIDATFQFDRQKLTLWYTAPERVYFVSLLKVLNQRFRCRIWMERVESKVATLSTMSQPMSGQKFTPTATHHLLNNIGNNKTNVCGGYGGGYTNANHNTNQNVRLHRSQFNRQGTTQSHGTHQISADRKDHNHMRRNNGLLVFTANSQHTEDINGDTVNQHQHHHRGSTDPNCTSLIPNDSNNNNINNDNNNDDNNSNNNTMNDNNSFPAATLTKKVQSTGNVYGRKRVTKYTDPAEADEIVNAIRNVSVSSVSVDPTATTASAAKKLNFDM